MTTNGPSGNNTRVQLLTVGSSALTGLLLALIQMDASEAVVIATLVTFGVIIAAAIVGDSIRPMRKPKE